MNTNIGYGWCDHSNAWTGIGWWNGLSYCVHCCKHNFRHKNFVCHLGDGFDTCTLCYEVIGQHIHIPPRKREKTRRVKTAVSKPKITLTDCDGVMRRVDKGI